MKLNRLPFGLSAFADDSANSVGADAKPSATRFHNYEVLLVGMAVAAIAISAQDYLTLLPSNLELDVYFRILGISALFFINTFLVFLILYFWGSRRLLQHLREKYLRISVLLFVGSAIGSVPTELAFLFVSAYRSSVPNFFFSSLLPYIILQGVTFSLTSTFIGLGAFLVAYFRHKE